MEGLFAMSLHVFLLCLVKAWRNFFTFLGFPLSLFLIDTSRLELFSPYFGSVLNTPTSPSPSIVRFPFFEILVLNF